MILLIIQLTPDDNFKDKSRKKAKKERQIQQLMVITKGFYDFICL